MASKEIEVTKADGTKHIVPIGNIKAYQAHNEKYKNHPDFEKKYKLTWKQPQSKPTTKTSSK